jgi:hypothetical protein
MGRFQMGYAVSWLAVKDAVSQPLLQDLGLKPTGEKADYGDALFTGRALSSGWFILFINECDHQFVQPKTLASISKTGDVIACSIEEHVMWSTAELWRDGTEIWRVEHDAQEGMCHLSPSGLLPDVYSAIEKEFREKQEQAGGEDSDTDYFFEIPLQTAKSIAGFKHDEAGPEDAGFMVFKSSFPTAAVVPTTDKGKKPWWKPW